MSEHITNGHPGQIEPPILQEAGLREYVRHLGRIFGILSLGCELVLELSEAPYGGEEG